MTIAVTPVVPPMRKILLANGDSAVVRPLVASDRPEMTAMFRAMSDDNVYLRFFTLGSQAVSQHVDHLFNPQLGAMAYVVERDGRIIGVADVEPEGDDSAEIAFAVADDAHGLGVATILLERAAEAACSAGITWFVADVLAVNHAMLDVFAQSGFVIETHGDRDDVSVRMSTTPGPAEISASAARNVHARANAATRT